MNLPNRITILRILLLPFFVILMLTDFFDWQKWAAFAVFVIASGTDAVDGHLARKLNQVTNFGKFLDPLADKLLVCSALICLLSRERIAAWVVIVIISREFIVSGLRLVAADQGVVIAAGMSGKIKTTVQMITILVLIAELGGPVVHVIEEILICLSVILTIYSMLEYLYQNRRLLFEDAA